MKIKKLFAAMAAAAVACSAFAFSASAEGAYKAEISGQFDTTRCDMEEWADISSANVASNTVSFNEGEEVTFTIDFGKEVAFAGNYVGLNTNYVYDEENPVTAELVSLKLDGNDVSIDNQVLTGEGLTPDAGGSGLRINLTNLWNSDITTQPVAAEVWQTTVFTTMEVTFIVGEAQADEPTDEPVEDEPTDDEPADDNVQTGAEAGLALAGIALAAAAIVATKKK